MKTIIQMLVFLFCVSTAHAQQSTSVYIDSVMKEMSNTTNDTTKARMYKGIADKCLISLPQKVLYYANAGLEQSKKMKWQKGKGEQKVTLSQYWVNFTTEFELDE